MQSLTGISRGMLITITTLPLIEITETGIEGATTGLVSSYDVLIRSVVATFSEAISKSSDSLVHDFSSAALAKTVASTRIKAFAFTLGQCGIHLVALLPSMYLLPRQKLDAQQMRTYGGYSRVAGLAILFLFLALVGYAGTVNVMALMHKY
jgi:hypothetical protein